MAFSAERDCVVGTFTAKAGIAGVVQLCGPFFVAAAAFAAEPAVFKSLPPFGFQVVLVAQFVEDAECFGARR